jgi:phenylacetaldehyde dehydrogenase
MHPSVLKHLQENNAQDETIKFLQSDMGMYIDGQWQTSSSKKQIVVLDPSNGKEITRIPDGRELEADKAVCAARKAFDNTVWRKMMPLERESLMHNLASLVEHNAQVIAEIEAIDAGKAISGCKEVDVGGSIDVLRYFAGWPSKIQGSTRIPSIPGQHFASTIKQPVGVVVGIVPWNWPLNMLVWKFAAAIAAGCTLVIKPAQQTSLSAIYFAKLVEQAGFPNGVFNLVTGTGSVLGNALISHPLVNKISFTGSTPVGRTVGEVSSKNLSHFTLELGGKSPMVVFADADISKVVAATQQSVYFNSGQVCSAGSRMYVHSSIYIDVIAAIKKALSDIKVGMPLSDDTTMGPVISQQQFSSIMNYIQIGQNEGADLEFGGEGNDQAGYFIQPTLFGNCNNTMKIVREEIFGPVLCVQAFDDEDEAIALANDNEFGLAASVFTKDVSRAYRAVNQIHAGTVWINTHDLVDPCLPFGGFKNSGLGKDLGPEQLEQYLETKTVWQEL